MGKVDQLRSAFKVIHHRPLAREDVEAILELAQLVVDSDGGESKDEIELYFATGKLLFELAGVTDAPVPTFAADQDDDERLFELATQLKTTEARELAFVVTSVLAEADLEVVGAEDTFLSRLRSLLSIGKERAAELDVVLRSA